MIFGHSSHHPREFEFCNGKLVLYGCGDFVNDYEGISGHEEYDPDRANLYKVNLTKDEPVHMKVLTFHRRKFKLVADSIV